MLERLIEKCIHRPIATLVIFAAIAASGLYAALNMPLEIIPSVDFPRLYIQTSWPGASPQSVEANLTSIIEGELTRVRGIANIRSESREGFSKITVELQPKADVDYLHFLIRERLSFVRDKLPAQAYQPRIIKYVPKEIEAVQFMSYQIVGPYSDAFLRHNALRVIRPVVNSIPGIAGVEVVGGRERQIQIRFETDRLKAFQLNAAELTRVLRAADQSLSAGKLIENRKEYHVVLHQKLNDLYDLKNLPIKRFENRIIYLRDVAEVADTLSPVYSFQRINGQATILLRIEKEPQANSITTADAVYNTIEELTARLPKGVQFIKEDDQSTAIRENLRQLTIRALFSFLVILIVLTLFLRRLRYAALIQTAVLFSGLATLLLMFLFRYSLNLITLAGLALGFGILVDNAIVVLENIDRRMPEKSDSPRKTPPGKENAERPETGRHPTLRSASFTQTPHSAIPASAAGEVALPLIASTLTTIAALLPFLFLMDELRLYYVPFAVTVSLALLASLGVSFFLIPTVLDRWQAETNKPRAKSPKKPGSHVSFDNFYGILLQKLLKRPGVVILAAIWIFGIPIWLLPTTIDITDAQSPFKKTLVKTYNQLWGSEFIQEIRPYLDHVLGGSVHLFYRYVNRGELWRWDAGTKIHTYVSLPPGTDIQETDTIVRRFEQAVRGMKGISQVRSRIYPTFAQVEVRFTREAEMGVTPFLAKEKLITRAAQTGNARVSVVGYGPGFSTGGGISFQYRLQLTGYNYQELSEFAKALKRKLRRFPRVRDVRTDQTRRYYLFDAFETAFQFDRLALATYNIPVANILQQTRPVLSQYFYRQTIRLGWEEVPFAVVARNYDEFQLYQLRNHRLNNQRNQDVRLGDLGALTLRRVQPFIERENQNYYKIITFDYLAPYRFARKFVDQFLQNTHVPAGFSLAEIKHQWDFDKSQKNITSVMIVALLLMYMVLAGLYESFLYPLLIFLMIPLSLTGVFLAYYFTDTTFDQAAYIGVIFLLGIVLNNGILLLDRVNQLKRETGFTRFRELIIIASRDRLRPILMTSLTTIAGLIPMLLLSKANVQDIWYSLALSTVGGLLSTVFLGLTIFPSIICIVEKWRVHVINLFRS